MKLSVPPLVIPSALDVQLHNVREVIGLEATVGYKLSTFLSDLLTEEDILKLAEISGCAAQARLPQCLTIPNLNKYRTPTSVCNNL